MEVNALVCTCGNKFEIPSLKSEATVKFADSVTERSKSTYFEEAVELAFQTTAPGDTNVRFNLLLWCIDHHKDTSDFPVALLVQPESLSWGRGVIPKYGRG